ncbi:MAG: hypothetical protein OEQ39_04880 [Gammaproteobacteria bacterium]|nr:hypothetical protein [Gammaproteobacteria bacterium]MDH3465093.1 hypothetical protein [Gammaproteobacteria bacterium]
MAQPRILEIDYQDFKRILQKAKDLRKKFDKTDKQKWDAYVRRHNVPTAGVRVKAKKGVMSDKILEVIIDESGAADGYYLYSPEDEFCLKFEPGTD